MFSARLLSALVLACSLGSLSAQTTPTQTVTQIVVASTDHTMLETLVGNAELAATLGGTGPFTLFAPTDAAFTALGTSTLVSKLTSTGTNLEKWRPLLADTLKYHVLSSETRAAALPATATQVDTVAGKMDAYWKVSVKSAAPQVTGVNAAGTVTPAQGEATVTAADNLATNGVVHVVDAVLLPPSTQRTVVDIAASTDFSTLTELLGLAGLVTTLQTNAVETAFTVFAPTNAAFAKIPVDTVNCLKNSANRDLLANLLKYHVVDGTVMSTDLVVSTTAGIPTLATGTANTFTYSAANTLTHSGTSMITNADNLANNGVVHVIDTVMIPTGFSCTVPAGSPSESSASASAPLFTLIAGLVASVFALAF
eukprot:CAMPEP_0206227764 /NCGR_PEP_ID=MMETSP0047_2-20121206/8801_1 /ASSEMBLY_ACC=CAM_ASM_000192 /TAXON_ID=195065 /ORGANISM="Chroomonas mesostigmatica_cf, Strain CCMP1168" /LENGTH=367 /DNA_ID=CAMNT_0053650945 /DNA_START=57 /DNA_END=1160 /DNA_ORIENTATION=-